MKRHIFVLDTSAIIALVQDITTIRDSSAPGFACVLGDNDIVIPRVVLDELADLRKGGGEKGHVALEAARQIENYSLSGCLVKGVETEKGGLLRIAPRPSPDKVISWDLRADVADHEILATALDIEAKIKERQSAESFNPGQVVTVEQGLSNGKSNVTLITQDRILRVLARSIYSIAAEELQSVCAPEIEYEQGYHRIELSSEEIDHILASGTYVSKFQPGINEFFHLVDRENPDVHYCYGMSRKLGSYEVTLLDRSKVDYLKVAGEVTGRNVRQKLFLWTLMGCGDADPMSPNGIRLITVCGPAGSGKSFLTIAAAWERLERGHFERIVITRPMVDVGTSIGYLPGTLDEKIRPWGGAIEDNLRAIVQVPAPEDGRRTKRAISQGQRPFDAKEWLEMEDRLELIPLTYIRGRTFRRCIVILEEAQNIERGPLKVLLTRLGEGSIVVIVGDMSQIDNQFLSVRNNGLVHAINAFRTWPQAVHLQLKAIVRSDLAEAASQRL